MADWCSVCSSDYQRMSRPVTQAAERERELARARSQWLKHAAGACQASQFRVDLPVEAL